MLSGLGTASGFGSAHGVSEELEAKKRAAGFDRSFFWQ
jgi:hypothetical protein